MGARVIIDTASPALAEILRRAEDRYAIHRVMAISATRCVKDRFAEMAQWQRNKFARPAQFWKRMYRATHWEADATRGAVVMPREVAQRFHGGEIRPTGGKQFLTIPASAKAYRRAARSFTDLILVIFKSPRGKAAGMLIQRAKVRKKTTVEVMYWLVRGVNQQGDPRVMPTNDQLSAAIVPVVEDYVLRGRSPRAPSV